MRKMYTENQVKEIIKSLLADGTLKSIRGPIDVEGATEIDGELTVLENIGASGNIATGGDIIVDGEAKLFENIVDKDGHQRFIEGDITIEAIAGFTQLYGKWALSGTHLTLVVAGSIENATTWLGGDKIYEVELPQWLMDKIIPVASQRIENKSYSIFDIAATSAQNLATYFSKSSGKLVLTLNALTTDAKRYFRFTNDLLIDNE